MSKKTVHFDPAKTAVKPMVGCVAIVLPLDHTSDLVSNTRHAVTSEVLVVHGDGSFETLNSIYVPQVR